MLKTKRLTHGEVTRQFPDAVERLTDGDPLCSGQVFDLDDEGVLWTEDTVCAGRARWDAANNAWEEA